PDWANSINKSLQIIDGHTHSTGQGAPIDSAAINVMADLDFKTFAAINVGFVEFDNHPVPNLMNPVPTPTAPKGAIYAAGPDGDLFYNTSAGIQIPITQG